MGRHFFSIAYFREIFEKISQIWANLTYKFCKKFSKSGANFAQIAQNWGKFLIVGKYTGPILVNVWVSFHFPSGTSLPTKQIEYPPPPPGTLTPPGFSRR